MTLGQQPQGRQPTLPLSRYRLVIGLDLSGQIRLFLGQEVGTAEAKDLLESIYAQARAYLTEVTRPPEPRTQPTPHYRPIQSHLPTTIDESG